MLDLFCGRWGWSRAFAARGWECVGVDLIEPPRVLEGCTFFRYDISALDCILGDFDFICASPPCEQFSVHGMRHFHPNPKYPEMGIALFNHTRQICEESGIPYVMENVRAAQQFVGKAVHHCGPFYLWGNAVPPLLPQGIKKGIDIGSGGKVRGMSKEEKRMYRKDFAILQSGSKSQARVDYTAGFATIPPELAACVADYATEICSQIQTKGESRG